MARARRKPWWSMAALGCAVSLIGVGTFALVRNFLHAEAPHPKKIVQEVRLIRPPPPPPDVPPPPPPEEKVDVTTPQEQPDPTPSNEPAPSEQLGLDAEGGAGSDAFGLLGHKGGRDLLASGGSAYAWYANLIKSELLDQLQDAKMARKGAYSVGVRVWVRSDGTVERVRLAESTGDEARDRAIESAATRIRLSQAPPAEMPQPISFRVVSHG